MLNQPIKILLGAGVVAVLGSSLLSHNYQAPPLPASAAAAVSNKPTVPANRGWYSNWFEGISFRRAGQSAPAQRPAAPVQTPQQTGASGFGAVTIASDPGGQYSTAAEIDGQSIPMLVDTGATVVALRFEDAQRLGIMPMPSDYTVKISTANGEIAAARTHLREVRVENIRVADVQAVVMPQGALSKSLLGMTFLKRLARFEVASGNLVLRP
ncbi:MAG: TIGR02281 family clan AA aspartic protease [Beijerinckiaceae bacterium]